MTDTEIFKAAIDKAIENGYDLDVMGVSIDFATIEADAYRVVFNHDFAKAFWGLAGQATYVTTHTTDWHCLDCGFRMKNCSYRPEEFKDGVHVDCEQGSIWQFHLQQMSLEENPIKYLEKFL